MDFERFTAVYRHALRGKMVDALEALNRLPTDELNRAERDLAERFRARFETRTETLNGTGDSTIDTLLGVYRAYWTDVMMQTVDPDVGEARLARSLKRWLSSYGEEPEAEELEAIADAVRRRVEARGLHSITGVTRPYWDLMVWRHQHEEVHRVQLIESEQEVRVVYLEDFLSLGWTGFATLARHYTGGWATDNELYCVAEIYDLESESFRVSYLQHEAQHFADYARFPGLEQPELEYRAKLAELAAADEIMRSRLAHFYTNVGTDRSDPHSYAQGRVMRALSRELFGAERVELDSFDRVSSETIRNAARQLLLADSASRAE